MFGSDSIDVALDVLRSVSIVLACAFGILALQKGSAKRKRITFIGIVVTALLALLLQGFEVVKRRREQASIAVQTLQEVQRFDKTLDSINRSLFLIRNISLDCVVEIPFEDERLVPFRKHFAKEVKTALLRNNYEPFSTALAGDSGSPTDVSVTIPRNSPFYPIRRSRSETLLSSLLGNIGITVSIYKQPIDLSDHVHKFGEADLEVNDIEAKLDLSYDVEGGTLMLLRNSEEKEMAPTFRSSGNIVSIMDLRGSQMIIYLGAVGFSELDQQMDRELGELQAKLKLSSLHLRMDNRDFIFTEKRLIRHVDRQQRVFYVFTFPNSLEEIYLSTSSY